tara:strand:- start:1085 stop:1657 length:573 start_codon:yes stop_codon:yes gene_type:complete
MNFFSKSLTILGLLAFLNSCADGKRLIPGADARKYPPNPELRVKKNIEEGRGFRLTDAVKKNMGGGNFEFASSNELWRASLDTIDFMPLASANYSGGIVITDWYSENNPDEYIKISIRFLTNEIRSDAVDIKLFYKKCSNELKCVITENSEGKIVTELKKKILKTAALYKEQSKDKKFREYKGFDVDSKK